MAWSRPAGTRLRRLHPAEWPCRIVVNGRNGARKVAEARYFKGHAKRPLTDGEVAHKFRALTGARLTRDEADAIIAKASRLEQLADLGELLTLFRFSS